MTNTTNRPKNLGWIVLKTIGMSLRDNNDLLDILDDAHKQKLLDDEMFPSWKTR